jgi:cytochrome c oxidase cbb3-type subunit 4
MTYYTQVAPIVTVVVVLVFIGIAAWAYWPKSRARFERDAQIPLRNDE